jgi:serine phosphatase RsbU (regulator of sigma subunit)
METTGSIMGVFETEFPCISRTLAPHDKILLYTDGIDSAAHAGQAPGMESLRACALEHRSLPVGEFVERLSRDLFPKPGQTDDLTMLALQITA